MWYLIYLHLRLGLLCGGYPEVRDLIKEWAKANDQPCRTMAGWKIHTILLRRRGWYQCPSCGCVMETPASEQIRGPSPKCVCCGEYLYPHPNDKEWHARVRNRKIKEEESRRHERMIARTIMRQYDLNARDAELAAQDERIQGCCDTIVKCAKKMPVGCSSLEDNPGEGFKLAIVEQELAELVETYRGRFH
jgi:hypothetical protein